MASLISGQRSFKVKLPFLYCGISKQCWQRHRCSRWIHSASWKCLHSPNFQLPCRKNNLVAGRLLSSSPINNGLDLKNIPNIKDFLSHNSAEHGIQPVKANHGSDDPPYVTMETSNYEILPFGKTVYFETYGCQMNVNDSEYAWAILKKAGYKKTDNMKKADVILLVTCSIREKAEEKIWNRLHSLKKLKNRHHEKKFPKLGILGCMAERLKKEIVEKEKAVDIIAGPDAYRDLPRLLHEATSDENTAINVMLSVDETYADIMPVRFDSHTKTAFVSIMRGCDNMCSYCIVPFTRGRERSRAVGSIIDEVKTLSEQGIRQVTLLGQNVNSYRDVSEAENDATAVRTAAPMSEGFKTIYKPKVGGLRFADLLERVSDVDPEMRIRFTSPHPKDFPDEVLQIIAERSNICNQIHLPAQSGSSAMLDTMRRGHTVEDYLRLVERIRGRLPDVALSTDIISGFCGETEADHQATLDLMNTVKYNYAFLFKYSMRKKTRAYHRMEDSVPEEVKQRRLREVIDAYEQQLPNANRHFVGRTLLVLVEKESRKSNVEWMGRSDGNLHVVFPRTALASTDVGDGARDAKPGDYVAVKVTSYAPNTLRGEAMFLTSLKDFHTNGWHRSLQQSPVAMRQR